jgi:type I restriction enzyme S subunit
MGSATDWIARLSIQPGDILISRGNGSKSLVGLAGLVANNLPESGPVLFPDTMIRARPDPALCDPRFFVLIWNSPFVRDQIERTARTTAGIHKISQTDIEQFEFPLPSLEDQRETVAIAEQVLTSLQHTNVTLARMLVRAARLRASILMSAFSGRLVAQNPSDEPASALLERFRAERTSVATNRQSRRGAREAACV